LDYSTGPHEDFGYCVILDHRGGIPFVYGIMVRFGVSGEINTRVKAEVEVGVDVGMLGLVQGLVVEFGIMLE
jgi:hypothetical protein